MKKRVILTAIVLALAAALVFTGCAELQNYGVKEVIKDEPAAAPAEQPAEQQKGEPADEPADVPAEQPAEDSDEIPYEFEFKDVDGNVHKLSDYKGKPVYLEIWASWCSVCKSAFPHMDELSAAEKDYHVLTVVAPEYYGEKDAAGFIEWWEEQGFENIVVMLDEEHQVIFDFGVQAFPSQVFFDAEGNFAGGRIGLMTTEQIDEQMAKIAAGE